MTGPHTEPGTAAQRPASLGVTELTRAVTELELVPYHAPQDAEAPAQDLERRARELGLESLVVRARLITADVRARMGDNAALGRVAHQALIWANARGDVEVQVRCQRLLSAFYGRLGDTATSLEHAVRAVELLPASAPAPLRVRHYMGLAVALMLARSFDAARDRFAVTLSMLDERDDPDVRVAVLNNLAYLELTAGDTGAAMRAADQMRAVGQRHGITMDAVYLDTIARAQIGAGRFAAVELTLAPILESDDGCTEPHDLAEALLTLAESQRLAGALDQALGSVRRALHESRRRGIESFVVRGLREHAAVLAARGSYAEAYEQLLAFHTAHEAVQSAERQARARTLHAAFATEEAVQQSRRYREMSLRDPLTGLYNRRYIDDRLPALLDHSRQRFGHLSVAIIDLDHFKRVNDEVSHDAGDKVLARLATLLEAAVGGDGSFVARLGGEEFLLVLHADSATAARVCQQLCDTIRAKDWSDLVGTMPITASVGVATTFAGGDAAIALLSTADRNLYRSKANGRDRVTA
ncbi:GGDEF domain-containing protein [Pilimelia columellifera]|uniref:GGDEF domain-containing protein n=1 Tax=Pilimelia columellifera subsp. columellifera TaxID=706583 RepID=A0ABN3MZ81_9ACTN